MTDSLRNRGPRGRLRVEHLEDRCTPSAAFAPGRVMVTFADPAGGSALAAVAGSPLTAGVSSLGAGTYLVALAGGAAVGDALGAFAAVPGVRFAEPDLAIGASVTTPNDPSFNSLWGLNNTGQSGGTADVDINAPEAWDTATGSTKTVVGVIDTGVDYTHPDLYLNIWINQDEIPTAIRSALTDSDLDQRITFRDLNSPANQGTGKITDLNANGRIDAGDLLNNTSGWENGADNDGNGYVDDLVGWDFYNNDNDPMDDHNHGTHVSGTIGAIGDNGKGVVGVAWTTQLMPLKFLGSGGTGPTSGAVAALNYATGEAARVTNNSWGGGGFSSSMETAIKYARDHGSIFVAAAGNSNTNNDAVANYPSNYNVDNVVAVASIDQYGKKSSFSSYGATTVDLGAPGSSIYSTVRNGGYGTMSGTSMATPHVTGALAVVLGANPNLTYQAAIGSILGTVRPVAALNGITVTGGVLNLQAALTSLSPPTSPPPPPPPPTSGRQAFANTPGSYPVLDRQTTDVPINVPTSFAGQTIADIDVIVNITHTYDRDLRLSLLAPNGKQVTLANRRGGSGDNFSSTVFDDEAAVSVANGSAPFAGSYRPEQQLSTFDGLAAGGEWQLRVSDSTTGDTGMVRSVTLSIEFGNGGLWVQTFGFADEPDSTPTNVALDFAPVRGADAPTPSEVVVTSRAVRNEPPTEPLAAEESAVYSSPVRVVTWPAAPTADPFAELADDFAPVEL